ncbi:hypothetical protein [Streptomyces sp. RK75]|uniref:hypothetical protein n=1 Tax=Streptomyces sp. RK75 TaxID=2824895 RepID=UPI001B380F31|nr:hypothetical protein [Streptomyces sp. RK75]MBQ0867346.1 hypothetical protein [Streptomyces sp. RK75]
MTDPTDPTPERDFSALSGGGADQRARARDAVQRVISWYGRELMQQRRSDAPDQARTEQLQAGLTKAQEDQRRLPHVDDDQVQQLADRYAALYQELTES